MSAACGGFSGEETKEAASDASVTPDASADSADVVDAGVDAAASDGGFGAPVLIRRGNVASMRGNASGNEFIYSEGTLVQGPIYRTTSPSDGGDPLVFDGGFLRGFSPTSFALDDSSLFVIYDAIGHFEQAIATGTNVIGSASITLPLDGGVEFPYVLPSGNALYFDRNREIYRCAYESPKAECTSLVSVKIQTPFADLDKASAPVVSPDEKLCTSPVRASSLQPGYGSLRAVRAHPTSFLTTPADGKTRLLQRYVDSLSNIYSITRP